MEASMTLVYLISFFAVAIAMILFVLLPQRSPLSAEKRIDEKARQQREVQEPKVLCRLPRYAWQLRRSKS